MSTEKKSAIDQAAEALEFEKLAETESGELAGGFSAPVEDIAPGSIIDLNISKCHCTSSAS